mmetsp:Transcript_28142/g.39593  ORF Transcript_28142/g.39593 Transcript_28142/m.39593 type:complete len:435 (-) Transcript_28142:133-1437(-)
MTVLYHFTWFFLLFLCSKSDAAACPKATPKLKSARGGPPARLHVKNTVEDIPIIVVWVDMDGKETGHHDLVPIQSLESNVYNTFKGHVFRMYTENHETLLVEHTVTTEGEKYLEIHTCDDVKPVALDAPYVSPYQEEMEALVHDQNAPCVPEDDSSKWSCIKYISKEDYEKRSKDGSNKYGFNSTVEARVARRGVGDTEDDGYVRHIPKIPRLTNGKGYLKMSYTKKLKDTLLPWYKLHKKDGPEDSVERHEPIPGGYTNSHVITMSKLDLDKYREIQRTVAIELQRILEWWTGRRLAHTSTFGIRIYHRGSMLINHVDRADTHLASAVIQVGQIVDQGWPLEVLPDDPGPSDISCAEVYLQPGEMVLYEGARFKHGRPMRFNGTDFANIFSHFRPLDWRGPGKSPKYDGQLDERGYRTNYEIHGGEEQMHSEL